ncbi:hypothetical protein OsI_36096 [Oryza sativa Indica Group]|uniref:Rab-GAP TBC domain-containing protein n=1 Tax=Oryza sativa subsp. indica TaxID=39946 RepID=B8BKH2_ORYSI|nr:hypothetical protein OsI_36096 [Oryza sativa Indica Group]
MPFFSAKANQESLRRVLIIFSKLNPTIRYVQGMNEVLAPLFYVFKNDPDTSNSASAEADTFFCFVELLSGFKDNYCKHLDNSQVGIRSTLSKLSQLLKRHDEELWRHMEITTKLSKKVVNMGELRRLACLGVPDGGAAVRPLVWKLLLGYLPTERAFWPHELEKKRSQYSAYKDEFLLNPSEKIRRFEESKLLRKKELNSDKIGLLPRAKVTNEEHPLSFGKSSLWNQYFQESEILEQIDRDVKRTHPEMPFFSAKANQESLRRILIVFSKLNPTIRYVQGMNEVLAPLFYVFKNDPDTSNSASAEADTFFCFVELLSGFKDNYCKHLDNSQVGIRSTLSKLSQLLKRHDEELWRHMEITTKVYPQYYAFRWITLLLTMEFSFNVCIHIWDAILGDPEGPPDTLLRICCAMLILVRRRLLAGDFTANIQLLQHYPPTNIDHLLHIANRLRGSVAS